MITDRTQRNVYRRNELATKGWANMSASERKEWLGDPLDEIGVNLMPYGPYYSGAVTLKYTSREITAIANYAGTYLYAVSIVGEASKYANKVFTLSTDYVTADNGGSPQLAVYWHDDSGYEYAGASLSGNGTVTFDTTNFPNTQNRQYLAVYVYVTTHETVAANTTVKFGGVMLENGATRHPYVPYTEVVPTLATKGAYNYSDLNRVERAVAEISEIANLGLVTKTNWAMWDVPTVYDMNRYVENIRVIRTRYNINIDVPTSMNNLTYETANNIEKIILAAYEMIAS